MAPKNPFLVTAVTGVSQAGVMTLGADASQALAKNASNQSGGTLGEPMPDFEAERRKLAGQEGEPLRRPRVALAALQEQQGMIQAQAAEISRLKAVVAAQGASVQRMAGFLAEVVAQAGADTPQAGIMRVAAFLTNFAKTADINNPAQPVPEPAPEAPSETTDGARQPAATDDVTQPGPTPVTNTAPMGAADPTQPGGVADAPMTLEDKDVTKPVAGTTDAVDLSFTEQPKTYTPTDTGPAQPWTLGSTDGRVWASLRLARLRREAGLSDEDDLVLGQKIAASGASDEVIDREIETLTGVLAAHGNQQARVASRPDLVPQMAPASASVPSIAMPATVAAVPEGGVRLIGGTPAEQAQADALAAQAAAVVGSPVPAAAAADGQAVTFPSLSAGPEHKLGAYSFDGPGDDLSLMLD